MIGHGVVLLALGICFVPADSDDEPETWKKTIDAAAKAVDSGKSAVAEALLIEVIEDAERLGGEGPRLATQLERLAWFYAERRQKRYADAEPVARRALMIRENTRRAEHPDVVDPLVLLAICRLKLGEKPEISARPMMRRARAIVDQIEPKDDPELARLLHIMMFPYSLMQEYSEAESALQKALAIREKAFGPDSAKVAAILDDLGDVHLAQSGGIDPLPPLGEVEAEPTPKHGREWHGEQAKSFYSRALAIREKVLPPDDEEVASTLFNLGQLAFVRENYLEGEPHLERWLAIQERTLTPVSVERAKALLVMAGASSERKDFAQSDERLSRAQAVFEKVMGAESEDASKLLCLRIDVARRAGHPDVAATLLGRLLEVQAARLGPDDEDVSQARMLLGGSQEEHDLDKEAPFHWHKLTALARRAEEKHDRKSLADALDAYARMLRDNNRVVPRANEADLAYWQKKNGVWTSDNIGKLAETETLFCDRIGDLALSHAARLYQLVEMEADRSVTDAGMAHLEKLLNLRILNLSDTEITDAGLAHLKDLDSLEELDLSRTRASDVGLTHLKGLASLRSLDLCDTDVSDAGLVTLAGFDGLRRLDLRKNPKLTDAGVDRLRRARPDLEILYRPAITATIRTR